MNNFHINPHSGAVSKCNAEVNDCPWLGSDGVETHFPTIKDARKGWEERMSDNTIKTHSLQGGTSQPALVENEVSEETMAIEEQINAQQRTFDAMNGKLRAIVRRSPNFEISDSHYQKTQARRAVFYRLLALKKARYDSLSPEMKIVDDRVQEMKTERENTKKARWFADQEAKNGIYNFHPDIDKNTGDQARQVITALSGLSAEEVNNMALAKMAEGKTITESFREVFAEVPLRTDKPIISVDIETAAPLINGWVDKGPLSTIIQVGYVIRQPDGTLEKNEYFAGVPDDLMVSVGTGAEHVHHITPEMVAGLTPLTEMPEKQKEILEVFKGGVLLAHNAAFEVGQFTHSVPGFARSVKAGDIEILDTQQVSRFYCPQTTANTNEAFVVGTGGEYVKAHRALSDAEMSMNALLRTKGEKEI